MSDEDVRHLRNRVEEFEFTEVVSALHDVESCAPCMAKWIIKGASDHDLSSGLPISTTSGASSGATAITGFHELMREVHLPQEFSKVCHAEILELGAVDVKELATDDWEALSCWHMLRRFEQRRLLKSLA